MKDQNKSNTQEALELHFKNIMEQSTTDPQLKNEVFSTIGKIEAAATLLDLFSVKFVQTTGEILDNIS